MTLSRLVRFTALLLIPALLSNNLAFGSKRPIDAASVKIKLEARGVGQGVRVTFADNVEAKGLIVSLGEQSFSQGKRRRSAERNLLHPSDRCP